ncbi:MAG: helix-turn-helix domain-containing protein [Spirochaetota bacterium]
MGSNRLHRRLLGGALILVAVYLLANVGFYLVRSYVAYRHELQGVAQAIVDRIRSEYDDLLESTIREALVSADRSGPFRDALLEYNGSYDHRVALLDGLSEILAVADPSVSAYALLTPGDRGFSTESGEFQASGAFYDHEAIRHMRSVRGIVLWPERVLQRFSNERVLTSVVVRVPDSSRHSAIMVNFDYEGLRRRLVASVPSAAGHELHIERPSDADAVESDPHPNPFTQPIRATARSRSFDRVFVLDLGAADVAGAFEATASFAAISFAIAALVFGGFVLLVLRSLQPLDRLLARVSLDDAGAEAGGIAALDRYLSSLMSENQWLQVEYERLLPERRKELLRDLFAGNVGDETQLRERIDFNEVPVVGESTVAAVLLLETRDLSEQRRLEATTVVERLLGERIDGRGAGFHVLVSRDQYGIALPTDPTASVAELEAPFLDLLGAAPEVIRDRMYVGVGAPVAHIHDLVKSYEQAQSALEYRLTLGRQVICMASLASVTARRFRYPYERERLLIERLQSGDEEGSLVVLNEMLDQIVAERLGDREIDYLRLRLVHALYRYLYEHELGDEEEAQALSREYDVRHAASIDEVRTMLTELVRRTIDAQSRRRSASRVALVRKFVDYTHDHCEDRNLRLLDLEEEFGLNRYYIGQLISEHTGRHFNDHLNEARVARAAEILQSEPGVPIKEVAERVGYAYPYYFTRQFKRFHGMTPRAYQESR